MSRDSNRPVTITASELNRAPGVVLRRVAVGKERIVVERAGYPIAVISPYEAGPSEGERLLEQMHSAPLPTAMQNWSDEQIVAETRKARKSLARKKRARQKNGKASPA